MTENTAELVAELRRLREALRDMVARWREPTWDEGMLDRRVYDRCASELAAAMEQTND